MNQKGLLALLEESLSEDNVRVAAEWIFQKKSSSKAAHRVLREVLEAPAFEPYLPTLVQWIKDGPWDELSPVLLKTKSVALFYSIVEILKLNPNHPQAGRLWAEAVFGCRDFKLITEACRWFIDSCTVEQDTAMLTNTLMADLGYQSVIEKARRLFDQRPEDSDYLCVLLEFDDYPPAIAVATNLIRKAEAPYDCIMEASFLLKQNPARHYPVIEEYVRKWWNHKDLSVFLTFSSEVPDVLLPLISEWCDSKRGKRLESWFIDQLNLSCASTTLADFVWSWCKKHLPSDEALEALRKMLYMQHHSSVPKEAVEYAVNWLQSNQEHSAWAGMFAALIVVAGADPRLRLNQYSLKRVDEDQLFLFMIEVFRVSEDKDALKAAELWRKKNSAWQCSLDALADVCERFPTDELLREAKLSLPTANALTDMRLQAALAKAGDVEAVAVIQNLLMQKQIIRRWSGQHRERGKLMATLLEGGHKRSEILELANEWLSLIPCPGDEALYGRVKRAVVGV